MKEREKKGKRGKYFENREKQKKSERFELRCLSQNDLKLSSALSISSKRTTLPFSDMRNALTCY